MYCNVSLVFSQILIHLTAWCRIMTQTSPWQKPENRICIYIWFSFIKVMHFIPNKEVEVTTEIDEIPSWISVCKLCYDGALISSRN